MTFAQALPAAQASSAIYTGIELQLLSISENHVAPTHR